ncbi:MAG: OstA-like protein [Flavobacteriaceae bacterium]|nr:OstA-like protein [Flavobacteriaceae bacterium]
MLKYFLLLFCCPFLLWAQKTPTKIRHVHSDEIIRKPSLFDGNLLFTGNVIFEHNGSVLKADSVVLYEVENYFRAFGNVRFTSEDNLLTSHELDYNGNTQIAQARGDVVLRNPEQTLYTDKLEYNRITNKAYFNTGGTIVSNNETITSQEGIYDLTTKSIRFDDDVRITNKDYYIESKNIQHFAQGDYMEFYDETFIQSRSNPRQYIKSTKGRYYLGKKEAYLKNRSSVYSDGSVLTADDIYFNQLTGYGRGEGDVLIENPEEKQFIRGGFGEYFQQKDSAYVTKDAYAVRAFEKDSLYIHADTLMTTKFADKNLIRAYHHAKFFKSNLQGKADSISFAEEGGVLKFFEKPVVWSGYRQITGDTILVYINTEAERLDSIQVRRRAFAISKTDSITKTQFHQLKSRDMLGLFVNDNLDWVQAEGNAQTLLYMEEEKKDSLQINKAPVKELVGINRSDCGIVEADFEERDINVISCRINAESQLYPPSKLPEDQRKLPEFLWREDERPLVWRDIFIIEN